MRPAYWCFFISWNFSFSDLVGQWCWTLSEYFWSCWLAYICRQVLEYCIFGCSLSILSLNCDLYLELYYRVVLFHRTNMFDSLASRDDFEEKLASFTPSALFLFKTPSSSFLSWEVPTSPNLSTSTRPIEIKKSQSTKHGVALVDAFVHVCDECICVRNRLRCCRSWPTAQRLYIPSLEGMRLPLTTTMALRLATIGIVKYLFSSKYCLGGWPIQMDGGSWQQWNCRVCDAAKCRLSALH